MTEKLKKVVFDAGPIIHLDELNCLDLLGEFQEILLAEGVWNEIILYRPLALHESKLSLIRCPQNYPTGEQLCAMCRTFPLDSGEIGALAIMENNPAYTWLLFIIKSFGKSSNPLSRDFQLMPPVFYISFITFLYQNGH